MPKPKTPPLPEPLPVLRPMPGVRGVYSAPDYDDGVEREFSLYERRHSGPRRYFARFCDSAGTVTAYGATPAECVAELRRQRARVRLLEAIDGMAVAS
jgi:hypothetical protein